MIICDLEHLEVVAEETSIVGATGGLTITLGIKKPRNPRKLTPTAQAFADANAVALGNNTFTSTTTTTQVAAGVGSSSSSSSVAIASGYSH